jgi:hypothetical protein
MATQRADAEIESAEVSGVDVQFTLNAEVLYTGGIPAFAISGTFPLSISAISPTQFTLTLPFAIGPDAPVDVPVNDPVFRVRGGGYIAPCGVITREAA